MYHVHFLCFIAPYPQPQHPHDLVQLDSKTDWYHTMNLDTKSQGKTMIEEKSETVKTP